MSQHGLAAAAAMSYVEAQHFIDEYFRVRPSIRAYIDSTVKKAHDDGFVETPVSYTHLDVYKRQV